MEGGGILINCVRTKDWTTSPFAKLNDENSFGTG